MDLDEEADEDVAAEGKYTCVPVDNILYLTDDILRWCTHTHTHRGCPEAGVPG